jgi:hypothetical protein
MMISNPKGWRNRRAAALVRQQDKDARRDINAQRWRAFQGLPPEKAKREKADGELSSEEIELEMAALANKIEANVNELAQIVSDAAPEPVDPETMSNGDLRRAIEAKGFEVPKTTARARLIEIYKEKVA